jgi:transcriptional regulator with XRE-family HTH domain
MKDKALSLSTLQGRLRWVIAENGLKQKEFAKALGVSENYVSLLMSGRNQNISEPLAKLIEKTYDYPPGWIINGDNRAEPSPQQILRVNTIQKLIKMDIHSLRSVAAFIQTLDDVKKEDSGK